MDRVPTAVRDRVGRALVRAKDKDRDKVKVEVTVKAVKVVAGRPVAIPTIPLMKPIVARVLPHAPPGVKFAMPNVKRKLLPP